MEAKTISRSELGDSAYIKELETILEDMSEQTEVMYEAIELSIAALQRIHEAYELKPEWVDQETMAEDMYRICDLALAMLKGEPEPDESTH